MICNDDTKDMLLGRTDEFMYDNKTPGRNWLTFG